MSCLRPRRPPSHSRRRDPETRPGERARRPALAPPRGRGRAAARRAPMACAHAAGAPALQAAGHVNICRSAYRTDGRAFWQSVARRRRGPGRPAAMRQAQNGRTKAQMGPCCHARRHTCAGSLRRQGQRPSGRPVRAALPGCQLARQPHGCSDVCGEGETTAEGARGRRAAAAAVTTATATATASRPPPSHARRRRTPTRCRGSPTGDAQDGTRAEPTAPPGAAPAITPSGLFY